jgi:hypothetical protein
MARAKRFRLRTISYGNNLRRHVGLIDIKNDDIAHENTFLLK